MTASVSLRNEILEYAFRQYGVKPEYLWRTSPDTAVLRRPDNRKWCAVLPRVPRNQLGLSLDYHPAGWNGKRGTDFSTA